jgi:hypothetical protein
MKADLNDLKKLTLELMKKRLAKAMLTEFNTKKYTVKIAIMLLN